MSLLMGGASTVEINNYVAPDRGSNSKNYDYFIWHDSFAFVFILGLLSWSRMAATGPIGSAWTERDGGMEAIGEETRLCFWRATDVYFTSHLKKRKEETNSHLPISLNLSREKEIIIYILKNCK